MLAIGLVAFVVVVVVIVITVVIVEADRNVTRISRIFIPCTEPSRGRQLSLLCNRIPAHSPIKTRLSHGSARFHVISEQGYNQPRTPIYPT